MSQFVVSARKYRPISFKEVISQPHITTTLKNAIARQQLAHAFLFCGPRGVGKTSCARILAKAINCLALTEEIEPCHHCTNCLSLHNNSSMNVYELDAASNNSVEDIRDLVDQVRYAPQMGKYKIYIIDEVHMLSNAAFNAFLKTLEEPPSYALFILATTERYKVLPTILSRCQIFNFNRIKLEDMVTQLQTIATQESIAYEPSALQLIAQKAEGAMRDALSIFDLITTSAGPAGTVTYAMARDHLQLLDYDYYFKCTEAFLKGDIPAVLGIYNEILAAGFHGHHFVVGLGEHLRNLLVCKDSATLPLLEVTDNLRPRYAAYASRSTMSFLLHGLTRLNQCDIGYKSSQHQRLHVELALIELTAGPLPASETVASVTEPLPDKPLPELKKEIAVSKPASAEETSIQPSITPLLANDTAKAAGQLETLAIPTLADLKASLITKEKPKDPSVKKKIATQQHNKAALTSAMVQSFFVAYGAQLKENGHMAGYHLMNQPIKLQDQVITISLVNPVQEHILQGLKEELLLQLRKKLNHPDIIIQTALVEEPSINKPYTDQEKLIHLSKKNSAIALLRERLMLEVAY